MPFQFFILEDLILRLGYLSFLRQILMQVCASFFFKIVLYENSSKYSCVLFGAKNLYKCLDVQVSCATRVTRHVQVCYCVVQVFVTFLSVFQMYYCIKVFLSVFQGYYGVC